MTQHCGLVAVLGAPNAGKSTLVNALVGQKVAIVSAKAQTTRARLMGIALEGDAQIILADTPGLFEPKRRLDRAMVNAAWEGASEADAILLVVDGRKKKLDYLEPILTSLQGRPERKILVLNKVDEVAKEPLLVTAQAATATPAACTRCSARCLMNRPSSAASVPRGWLWRWWASSTAMPARPMTMCGAGLPTSAAAGSIRGCSGQFAGSPARCQRPFRRPRRLKRPNRTPYLQTPPPLRHDLI